MFVIPKPGKTIPDPQRGDALPPDGREVEASQYWQRRLRDGDVTIKADEAKPKKVGG